MTCREPGSLGRHRQGEPDWCGRSSCDCGAVTHWPAGTTGLPTVDPLADFLATRVFLNPAPLAAELARRQVARARHTLEPAP